MQQKTQQIYANSNSMCLFVIGMSGTGKTTFVTKMCQSSKRVYPINLDPAVKVINYKPFVDIRETHQYKKVMKQYKLGPNGAILTALNLYTSQPQNIVQKVQTKMKENNQPKLFLVDIPGQIQVFTWSASSLILTEALATLMPVKILYIVDANRCQNPNVFLSNLLFSQSIEYRLKKFPFVIALNKSDCADCDKLMRWMVDYQQFLSSLQQDSSYLATLNKSIVLHLSQFYEKMKVCKISSKTGYGFGQLQKMIDFNFQQS